MPKPRNARLRRLEEERRVRVDERLGDKCGDQLLKAFQGFPWPQPSRRTDEGGGKS